MEQYDGSALWIRGHCATSTGVPSVRLLAERQMDNSGMTARALCLQLRRTGFAYADNFLHSYYIHQWKVYSKFMRHDPLLGHWGMFHPLGIGVDDWKTKFSLFLSLSLRCPLFFAIKHALALGRLFWAQSSRMKRSKLVKQLLYLLASIAES